jgi:DNA-binding beta-propeller fold protein YncE
MGRPYGLLRAGFPYVKCLGMRRITNFPVDVALGGEGRVYILCRSDQAAVIRKYTFDDEDLGTIGKAGKGDGEFQWAVSLIADKEENLFVSDEANHRISSFDSEGEFRGKWGEYGDGEGQINGPSGLAFDADENVLVVDTLNHRVQKFTKDGKYLMGWGSFGDGDGEFNMPWGITVDELGDVYIVDWRNDRVQKFSADGEFIFSFGSAGSEKGEFNRPTGVAVDSDGDIYVADRENNRVQLFNSEPRFVEQFIGDATLSKASREYMMTNASPNRMRDMADLEPAKRLRRPASVTVDEQGRMFVPDFGSYRVQVYQKEAIHLDSTEFGPPRRSPTLNQE